MRKWMGIAIVIVVGLVLAACTTGTGGGGEAKPIKIGYVGDFSDVYSYYDVPIRDGARFAIDEINKAGGVLGRPLELITRDGRNDQALAVRLTEDLIKEGIVYLIGSTGDPSVAQGLVACEAGIPTSTGDSTAPTLVGDMGECAFQLVMSDNVQGAVAAQFAYDQGYRTAYLLRSTEIPYTDNLPRYFRETFERLGGQILGEEQYRIDTGDYSPQVTTIANLSQKPDVIFTPMFPPDTPVFMRQLRAAGVDIPVVSTDGNHDVSLLDAGQAVEGMIFTTHAFPVEGSALADFYARYEKASGEPPASVVYGVGYDEMYILKQAIEAAGSAEPSAIRDALSKLSGFQGITGKVTMDPETRRAKKPVTLVKVEDNSFTFVDKLYPDFVPEP